MPGIPGRPGEGPLRRGKFSPPAGLIRLACIKTKRFYPLVSFCESISLFIRKFYI